MIHFDDLTYTYPETKQPALANVTLEIAKGKFALVAGLSGSGKSTLLRCLNGLVPHFSGGTVRGKITVAGLDPVSAGPQTLSQIVGFVAQNPEGQFVLDRVEDEVAFALENAALPRSEMHQRIKDVLRLLDLNTLRNRSLTTLSGGEKQRVAIAAALALRPRVLVLDEPTSQLDPQSAEDVLQALVRLNQTLGLTIVLAEHRLERVLPFVDQLIYLEADAPVLSGSPREILTEIPLTPPIITLGKALSWSPLPMTVEEAQPFTEQTALSASPRARQTPKRASLLRIEGLHYAYEDTPALRDVNIDVGAGELVVLMGRNGSGKTTLLKCIVGLLQPEQGQITLAGRSLLNQETVEICRDVGYLPQTPDDLLFADTVTEELAITLQNHDLLTNPPLAPTTLLERLGLAQVRTRYPRDLSVGQRQRVALGAITVTRPRVLLLDEPTRGLDYHAKETLVQLLQAWQAAGTAIILTTHDVELAAQAAERLVILRKGEVVANAPPESLTGSPWFSPQVARLFPGRGWLTPEDILSGQ